MKTLGSIVLITGLIITIVGIGQVGSISCNCPVATVNQPLNCQCIPNPQQQIGLIIEYVGIAVCLGGAGIIFTSVVKKSNKRKM